MGGTMRMKLATAAACAGLVACGGGAEDAGEFNGRVEGSVEGVLRGGAWFCDAPSGALLVVEDERRGSMIVFEGPQDSLKPGAWLLNNEPQPGGFVVHSMLQNYPDPDAARLESVARGGTLTLDTVAGNLASGRFTAQTVTVDAAPRELGNGRIGRIPNRAGTLAGFFRATRRECPATRPAPAKAR